jgi:hypothetical protein
MWVISHITNTNFEVGYYLLDVESKSQIWIGLFSYKTIDDAASQCNYLNGGSKSSRRAQTTRF